MVARPRPGQRGSIEQKPCAMSPQELDEFYRRVFLPLARRIRWRFHLSREDAWDIVQDAFLVALAKIDSARNPKAWMIQVVDHLALNHQRKNQRRGKLASEWLRPDSAVCSSGEPQTEDTEY